MYNGRPIFKIVDPMLKAYNLRIPKSNQTVIIPNI